MEELLDIVGLSEKRSILIKKLSGGQKQMVTCDEATSTIDSKTTKLILNLLRDLQKILNLTIVLVIHQIEVIRDIANKACVISEGEIFEMDNTKDIFASPSNLITYELNLINHFKSLGVKYTHKIIFKELTPNKALISQMIKKFNIDVNIINAHIDFLSQGEVGHLII